MHNVCSRGFQAFLSGITCRLVDVVDVKSDGGLTLVISCMQHGFAAHGLPMCEASSVSAASLRQCARKT
jgi:hypothetical protein